MRSYIASNNVTYPMRMICTIVIMIMCICGCAEFSAVKSPSVTITQSDMSSDQCTIVLTAGRYGYILYTTDGTTPTMKSSLYESPICLSLGTTLRTASFCPGGRRSEVVTVTVEPPKQDESVININNSEYCSSEDKQ